MEVGDILDIGVFLVQAVFLKITQRNILFFILRDRYLVFPGLFALYSVAALCAPPATRHQEKAQRKDIFLISQKGIFLLSVFMYF